MSDIYDQASDLEEMMRDIALRTARSPRPAIAADCAHCEEYPAATTHTGMMARYCARCADELGLTL